MSGTQVPTYHLAPNFSLGPPPHGMLHLGTIIENLTSVEPLNEDCRLDIPQAGLYCDHKKGFSATRSNMKKGDYGVWAKFVGIEGLGGELGWATERRDEDTYSFKGIDTIYFNPKQEYLKNSMNEEDVQEYMKGRQYEPVFIITGLKIARGPTLSSTKFKKREFKNELTLSEPGGAPIDVGFKINPSSELKNTIGVQKSDDFIFGIRVKRLTYRKHWFSKQPDDLDAQHHYKGATLVGADDDLEEQDNDIVELELDEKDMEGKFEETELDGDSNETNWVVPQA
ncbi:hypothetical protein F5882DRAFT_409968 [Hyaloscypha sp. PMI_1271]|nr:hypothetical protein F5882DRAFT_409968 [Hyaloscypha sp. PMI_1271]